MCSVSLVFPLNPLYLGVSHARILTCTQSATYTYAKCSADHDGELQDVAFSSRCSRTAEGFRCSVSAL